jgi:DNA-packaging protein gp3
MASEGKDPSNGQFIAGNKFWLIRSSHGRNPIFASAGDLWTACVEYFEWVEENPLFEAKAFAYEGCVTIEKLEKMRAMTIDGLVLFLDISRQTWNEYKKLPDFIAVTEQAENVIRSQKFGGAAAGLLNANIIARDLGLSDKTELTGKDGGAIETKELGKNERGSRIALALRKAASKGTS